MSVAGDVDQPGRAGVELDVVGVDEDVGQEPRERPTFCCSMTYCSSRAMPVALDGRHQVSPQRHRGSAPEVELRLGAVVGTAKVARIACTFAVLTLPRTTTAQLASSTPSVLTSPFEGSRAWRRQCPPTGGSRHGRRLGRETAREVPVRVVRACGEGRHVQDAGDSPIEPSVFSIQGVVARAVGRGRESRHGCALSGVGGGLGARGPVFHDLLHARRSSGCAVSALAPARGGRGSGLPGVLPLAAPCEPSRPGLPPSGSVTDRSARGLFRR